MLESGMMEGETGEVSITDMNPDVFRALLHFIYSDDLPEELQVLHLNLVHQANCLRNVCCTFCLLLIWRQMAGFHVKFTVSTVPFVSILLIAFQ